MFCVIFFQGVGKSTLARKVAKTWNCILIDGKWSSAFKVKLPFLDIEFLNIKSLPYLDTDLLNSHISDETEQGIQVCIIIIILFI